MYKDKPRHGLSCRKVDCWQTLTLENRLLKADIHDQIIEMALELSKLSSLELAARFTDEKGYFVSEAGVYRLLRPTT